MAMLGRFGHDHSCFLFKVISRCSFHHVRNLGCAVKPGGQTSALRFGQACAGKVEIWMHDSHACCP